MDPLLGELAYELTGITPLRPTTGFYSSVDREVFYRAGHEPVHTIDYFTKGLRHSVWFSQAIAKSVENGHRTFLELSPNPAVLISVAAVTFSAGLHDAELIETLRRKEDESYGLVNALMKLYVHGHQVDVASLFGRGGHAAIPRTRFERKEFWLTAKISSGGSAGTVPGSHVALPDGRHAWEVNAAAVTDPRELVRAAAAQVLANAAVGASVAHSAIPASGTLTTTLSPHPGGAAVTVHAKADKNFQLLFEAAVTGDLDDTAGEVTAAPAAPARSGAEVFADDTVVVEDDVVELVVRDDGRGLAAGASDGLGVRGTVAGHALLVGRPRLLADAAEIAGPIGGFAVLALGAAAPARAPVTILISIDGFRADYLDRGVTPTLDRLRRVALRLLALQQRIAFQLGLDEVLQLEVRQLQQLDRLLQLRRHHQRLRLPEVEAGAQRHRRVRA